ncbi:deoxycytidylate deaminase [Litoreibacter halocynthiae]|uniref:deoxycytidylate deaminase n=1 Tax=Litoreibacter halocynthiae TaxID=1242689 RepID=UPI0024924651|nr:dCMP deaminase family protein [Litoreibacter halocynthiae]
MTDWNERFLQLAELVSGWSKDPSTKVGCVLVGGNNIVLGLGYNGFPRGVEDTSERLDHRETKYLMVQHAETNAIQNTQGNLGGATAYVTHKPCANCCGALIQAGISKVISRPTDEGLSERLKGSYKASEAMMKEAGIEFLEVSSVS